MRTEASIEIDRPIEDVFDYTTNNVAEWSITVVEDEVVEQTPDEVGSKFRCVTEDHGHRMEFDGVITEHKRPTLSACYLTGSKFDIDVTYQFENRGKSTQVTVQSRVIGKGLFGVMFFLTGWFMKRAGCKAQQKELESLKRNLEGKPA